MIKEKHTGYVTANCIELAKFLNFSKHDSELAEIIGLFHDVGRFRQYSIYKTFNDADSEDHADLGIKVIEELEFFKKLSAVDYEIVKFAIQQHNKKNIAATDDDREILFAKIIRDADKLDIYRVLQPYFAQENADKLPNFITGRSPEISPDFLEKFVRGEQVDYREIRTNGDRKLVRLMWVYNVYFKWTMKKILERGYIDEIVKNLPMNEKVRMTVVVAASAPPAAMCTLQCIRYGRNSVYASQIFTAGTVLSVATLPMIVRFTEYLTNLFD